VPVHVVRWVAASYRVSANSQVIECRDKDFLNSKYPALPAIPGPIARTVIWTAAAAGCWLTSPTKRRGEVPLTH
jgi:hypothetical protein